MSSEHGHTSEAQADPYLDALVIIEGRAKLNAIAARALGRADDEREWLAVLATIERALS